MFHFDLGSVRPAAVARRSAIIRGDDMSGLVLVVDDYVYNVKLLEALLRAERYEVVTAYGGEEALAQLAQCKPDIVLLDVMMPGMDGYEVCARIRQNSQTAHLPVVMVTALDKPSDRDMALAAGADDFMTKPVEVATLFPMMRRLLEARPAQDQLSAKAS
jgi:two-component system cell cycle response regulator